MAQQVRAPRRRGCAGWLGLIAGIVIALVLIVAVGMPLAIGHRRDLPLERLYGDFAVEVAVRTQAGSATNPLADSPRALEIGRAAYTGSCAVCHGAAGDGRGAFGDALYPPASDLRDRDTQEKSDAQLFWIFKNGLSFLGMPGFGDRYSDEELWALVRYTRSLGKGANAEGALPVPTATGAQLAVADPHGDAVQRGAAAYFAHGCALCHGPVGNAPGELRLRGAREVPEAVRRGRRGMPSFDAAHLSEAELNDLVAYIGTFGRRG